MNRRILCDGALSVYTTLGAEPFTLDNNRALWLAPWPYVSDGARHGFGTRLARFLANADQAQVILARQLIDLVQGAAYLPQEIKLAEMAEALDGLMDVHLAMNNSYNEPRVARRLAELVGQQGSVPKSLVHQYVRTLVRVFLTNGRGEVFAADPIYLDLLSRFDTERASIALRSFADPEVASQLQFARWSSTTNVAISSRNSGMYF